MNDKLYDRLQESAGPEGSLSYWDFVTIALYEPSLGYYSRKTKRVGKTPHQDFSTALSLQPLLGHLVVEAVKHLLPNDVNPKSYHFVELGAEPDNSLLNGIDHPFNSSEVHRLGDNLKLPTRAIVFANELLDAQPFRRLIFSQGVWQELGVIVGTEGLRQAMLPDQKKSLEPIISALPLDTPEGYCLDWPQGAETLVAELCSQDWQGLMIFLDYGKDWIELTQNCPAGTARAYHRQTCHKDLLARLGEQDITCHICWDRIEQLARDHGFSKMGLQRQEAFFMEHAYEAIKTSLQKDTFNAVGNINQLLHPSYMGHAFQAFWAWRGSISANE